MRKNCAKFRLIVVWFGRTRDVKDFSDVTLAWEDEEQGDVWDLQVKVKVNNFNDMALAWEDEVWEKSSRTSRKVNVNWSTWAWEDGLKWKLFDERNYFEILSRRVWFYRWRIAWLKSEMSSKVKYGGQRMLCKLILIKLRIECNRELNAMENWMQWRIECNGELNAMKNWKIKNSMKWRIQWSEEFNEMKSSMKWRIQWI